jgi:hypothetical protein
MESFEQFLLHEILKEGIRPTIRRAYTAFGIGETDHTVERFSELKEELSEVRNRLQMIGASLKRIENKIDENRVAGFLRGFYLLRDASRMTNGKIAVLEQSLVAFHDITGLPPAGKTAQWRNAELKAIASFGVAAVHHALGNSDELIAEHLVEGFLADPDIARAFIEPSLFEKFYALELKMRPKVIFSFISNDIDVVGCYVDVYDDDECVGQACHKGKPLEAVISPGSHSYKVMFLGDEDKVSQPFFINVERGKEYHFSVKSVFLDEILHALLDVKRKLNLTEDSNFDEDAVKLAHKILLEHVSTNDISPEALGE